MWILSLWRNLSHLPIIPHFMTFARPYFHKRTIVARWTKLVMFSWPLPDEVGRKHTRDGMFIFICEFFHVLIYVYIRTFSMLSRPHYYEHHAGLALYLNSFDRIITLLCWKMVMCPWKRRRYTLFQHKGRNLRRNQRRMITRMLKQVIRNRSSIRMTYGSSISFIWLILCYLLYVLLLVLFIIVYEHIRCCIYALILYIVRPPVLYLTQKKSSKDPFPGWFDFNDADVDPITSDFIKKQFGSKNAKETGCTCLSVSLMCSCACVCVWNDILCICRSVSVLIYCVHMRIQTC